MESKRMFLVVCVIGCAVSFIKAESNPSTPTTLTSKISRNECGKTKLCLDNPKGCDPSASSQCFFTSAILTDISLTVELSGNSTGYIALAAGLTSNIPQDRHFIFVCGNNNSGIFFQTTALYNHTLWITNIPNVNNIQGSIQSSLIQCVFTIPNDANFTSFLSSVNGTNFNISNSRSLMFIDIWKGSTNGTVLAAPTSVLESSVLVNLLDVNSTNVVSTTAGTTANTTAGTTANTTANTKAGTTANTTAGTTANTTAGTTANTTSGTTAGTTARTTAKSNASISLTSLLSHVAICLLSIFLHLI